MGTESYEACCHEAQKQARAMRLPCYVITWIDGRVSWQFSVDRVDRLFSRRITRIDLDGRRTVETARMRVPR